MPDTPDTLAFYGGAVKALGNGKIAGYGVLFTAEPDLQGERFTKETDLMIDVGDRRPILYRHGMHPLIKQSRGGTAVLKNVDDEGAFFEGELDVSDKYWAKIYQLAEIGKLGWSTGSMPHLVKKEMKDGTKGINLTSWPIGEISLTPCPVEARTRAFTVKSLDDETDEVDALIKSEEEPEIEFEIAGTPALKAFCEDMAPHSLKDGSQRSKSAAHAVKEFITIGNLLGEAIHSYTSLLVRHTENRFLKENRPLGSNHVMEVESLLEGLGKFEPALATIKDSLQGIKKISDLSKAEQRAMNEKAKFAMWNYYRISGVKPEELDDGGSTSQHI